MALSITKHLAAGLQHVWISSRNTAGYGVGIDATPNTIANGATQSAYRRAGAVSVAGYSVTPDVAVAYEGNQIVFKDDLGVSDISNFDLVFATEDEYWDAYTQNYTIDQTTVSNWNIAGGNTGEAQLPSFFLAFCNHMRNANGLFWRTVIYNNVQIRRSNSPVQNQQGGTNPNNITYTITPTEASRTIWGTAISTANSNLNQRYYTQVISTYPLHHTYFQGDNSEDTVTLPFLPTSTDATGAADHRITLAGATQAASTVSTSTAEVAFAAAPAAAAIINIVYQTQFVVSS